MIFAIDHQISSVAVKLGKLPNISVKLGKFRTLNTQHEDIENHDTPYQEHSE